MHRQREQSDSFIVQRYDDARAFHRVAWEPLLRRECETCVPIAVLGRLVNRTDPHTEDQPHNFYAVQTNGGEPVQFAMQTPAHPMLITGGPSGASAALGLNLSASGWQGEVVGPAQAAREFAEACGPDRMKLGTRMRLFELTSVIDPPAVSGEMREAEMSDLELLAKWRVAFSTDVGIPVRDDGKPGARAGIEEGRAFLWTVARSPVATTGIGGETPNSVRVSAVYTPPEYRRKGYATSLVASVSRRMLASGRKYCTLFTDLSNLTSNSIYRKIGYHPVADFEHWKPVGEP